jgi:lipid II:glycine glycyltransferase (peptidoglycan interpeptide bridge formation enzyme)
MPTAITPQLPATVIVDVRPEEAALLAAMHEKTRYNVRLAQRRGVKIRHGGKADLPILHDLLKATGVRQDFEATPITSLESTWDSFGSDAALLLAEVEGEAVSAGLFLGFGDTVSCKRAAWSGEQGRLHPNELLHWAAMLWAKETGRHHYDFEGLHADVAKAALEPASPERPARGVATFKLGFGGTIELGSPAYGIFRHGALKFAYRLMPQSLLEGKFTRRLAARTRR